MAADSIASGDRPVVAVINTTLETIAVLQEVLEDEGFTVVSAYILDFKRGKRDLSTFFATHQPQVVVCDIALPYVENWTFFHKAVLAAEFLPEEQFVLTTTNKKVLEELVGATRAIELIGRPFDLDTIIAAVQRVCTR